MIPQLGFAEILVIAILALVVVGPKDLPKMSRQFGHFVGKLKRMGQEFKDTFEQMDEGDDLAELKREIEELKSMGRLENLSDDAFAEDMRALDRELQDGVSPAKPNARSKS